MCLNKAIEHDKEKREPYKGSKSIDKNCENYGNCNWCKGNRLCNQNKSREQLNKEWRMIQNGKRYDLEIITVANNLNYISMSPHYLKQVEFKKYKNVELITINGLGVGQIHFLTENGEYLMVPWCYVISMIPS